MFTIRYLNSTWPCSNLTQLWRCTVIKVVEFLGVISPLQERAQHENGGNRANPKWFGIVQSDLPLSVKETLRTALQN
jgi:hypothetical protein